MSKFTMMESFSSTISSTSISSVGTESIPSEQHSPKTEPSHADSDSECDHSSIDDNIQDPKFQNDVGVDAPATDSSRRSPEQSCIPCQDDVSLEEGEILEDSREITTTPQIDVANDLETPNATGIVTESIVEINHTHLSSELPGNDNTTDMNGSMESGADREVTEETGTTVQPSATGMEETMPMNRPAETLKTDQEAPPSPEESHSDESTTIILNGNDTLPDQEKLTATSTPNDVKTSRNIPPHLRPGYQNFATRQAAPRYQQQARLSLQSPHSPSRPGYPMYTSLPSYGGGMNGEQLARLNAKIVKLESELNTERTKNINLHKTLETEYQRKTEAVLSTMWTDLFQKQIDVLTTSEKNDDKARDLEFRERRIQQLEVFLSEGQKQFYHELDERGLRSVAVVESERIKRDAELVLQKDISVIEGDIGHRLERLRLRESNLQMREHQYKTVVRKSIEAEVLEKSFPADKVDEIAEVEYNNGFAAGKNVAQREVKEEAHEKGFRKGYEACLLAQSILARLRAGKIAGDSTELEFLWDPDHPHNLYKVGTQMRMASEKKAETPESSNGKIGMRSGIEDVMTEKKAESSVRRSPPSRPTFASQFRGAQTLHDGHIVLANGTSTPSPASKTIAPVTAATPRSATTNGNTKSAAIPTLVNPTSVAAALALKPASINDTNAHINGTGPPPPWANSPVGEGIYAGRQILRYEESSEEEEKEKEKEKEKKVAVKKQEDLIDLLG